MDKYYDIDNTITCPYNESHRIEKGTSFQLHLIKCGKDYPDVEKVICPFNYTHRIKKPELRYHLSVCPDADTAKKQLVTVKEDKKYVPPVLSMTQGTESEKATMDEENWDDELPAVPVEIKRCGVNQNLHFINADRLSGMKPAEKRRIRQLLCQGESIDEILNQGKPEVEEIQVQSTTLKKLPSPKSDPPSGRKGITTNAESVTINAATNNNPTRIAAAIFPKPSFAALSPPVPNTNNASPIMGRGFAGPIVSRPPPGLEKPELKSCGRGVAIQTRAAMARIPPGFGSLYDNQPKHDDVSDLDSEAAASQVDETAEREKRVRRIEKKLKQIEHLKNKQRNGVQLNDEELAKVENEVKFRQDLRNLSA